LVGGVDTGVFFSNTGAPLALEIIKGCDRDLSDVIKTLGKKSKKIKQLCADEYVARRYQEVLDTVQK
jgi:hypothetical protein